jgi:long-chain acyl-CoA synthetase
VFGLERDGNAEAFAVLTVHDRGADAAGAIQRANESLAEFQHIRRWLVWPEEDFPRTSTQKPNIKLIQEFVLSRLERTGREAAGGGMLADIISGITGRRLEKISGDSNLAKDLNLSSIERVELLSALEDRFQLDLNESSFAEATTVGELEAMLGRPAHRGAGIQYPRWAQSTPIAVLRIAVYYALSWPATMLMARPSIRGRENLKHLQGPLLFVANHITQVDVGFVLAALPLRFRHRLAVAMIGEMLQDMKNPPSDMKFLKRQVERLSYWLVTALFNVFPLPQKTGFRGSFSFAGESADRGYSILVFPEGRRTQDGNMSPFQAGIGLLATNLNVPVVPVKIDGLYELKKAGRKLARPGAVKVTIGTAMRFDSDTDPFRIARELESSIASLGESGG